HLFAFFVILRYRNMVKLQGDTLKLYLEAAVVFRFLVEFVRGNPEATLGLSGAQVALIPLSVPLVYYFVRQWRRGVYRMPAPPLPSGASVTLGTSPPKP